MNYVRVKGTNLIRDTNSMGLTNNDMNGLEDYKTRRRLLKNQKEEINKVKSEIKDVKDELSEIKSLMLRLLDKG
jgi:hypothetical protein